MWHSNGSHVASLPEQSVQLLEKWAIIHRRPYLDVWINYNASKDCMRRMKEYNAAATGGGC